jgi:hypothetical protein
MHLSGVHIYIFVFIPIISRDPYTAIPLPLNRKIGVSTLRGRSKYSYECGSFSCCGCQLMTRIGKYTTLT